MGFIYTPARSYFQHLKNTWEICKGGTWVREILIGYFIGVIMGAVLVISVVVLSLLG